VPVTDPARALSRRRLLALAGVGTAAAALPVVALPRARAATGTNADASTSCSATDTDEQEVGPFYVAEGIVRSDTSAGEDGIPLTFTITIEDSDACAPLVGAAVDVWQANALGVYSDESSEDTVGETYLRGLQITDDNGQVTFAAVYPGWYSGRTQHIHYRIYTGGSVTGTSYDYSSATLIHTGQMFFDPSANAAVAATAPYDENTVSRTTNAQDRVYSDQHGSEVLTTLTGDPTAGYTATLSIAVAGGGTSSGTDATSLSLSASHTEIRAGKRLTLSGVLLDTVTAQGLVDRDITVTAKRRDGTTSSTVVETGADGDWSVTLHPTATATYTASWVGNSTYAAASSSAVTVPVDYHLVLTDISGTAPARQAVRATGTLRPARKGVVVRIHTVTPSGNRRTLTTTTTTSNGDWSARWHLSKGKHTIVATVHGDTYDRGDSSRTVVVRRT